MCPDERAELELIPLELQMDVALGKKLSPEDMETYRLSNIAYRMVQSFKTKDLKIFMYILEDAIHKREHFNMPHR